MSFTKVVAKGLLGPIVLGLMLGFGFNLFGLLSVFLYIFCIYSLGR